MPSSTCSALNSISADSLQQRVRQPPRAIAIISSSYPSWTLAITHKIHGNLTRYGYPAGSRSNAETASHPPASFKAPPARETVAAHDNAAAPQHSPFLRPPAILDIQTALLSHKLFPVEMARCALAGADHVQGRRFDH
jgi:hypothetical protein